MGLKSIFLKVFGFSTIGRLRNRATYGKIESGEGVTTYGGIMLKTLICIALIIGSAVLSVYLLTVRGMGSFLEDYLKAIICLAVLVVPLFILSMVSLTIPKVTAVLVPILSVIVGLILGLIASFIEVFISGITTLVLVTTITVFLFTVFTDKIAKKLIGVGFIRFILTLILTIALVEGVLYLFSLVFEDCEMLFSHLFTAQLIIVSIFSLISVSIIKLNLKTLDQVLETQATFRNGDSGYLPKKYEWVLAQGLIELLIMVFLFACQVLALFLLLFGWIFLAKKVEKK